MKIQLNKKRIVTARLERGWSVPELARRAGISAPSAYSMEKGTKPARVATVAKVCAALGLKNSEVFTVVDADN